MNAASGGRGPGPDHPDGAHPNGDRPSGRDAPAGQGVRTVRRRRGGGERLMVEKAEFTSYYGRPVVKAPSWSPTDIAGYFFLGGLAGAGSVLAAGAELTGRREAARAMKISSLAAIAGSAAALVHDLGRPSRFPNMLRVFKPTSPMSMGSWLLAAYGPLAGAAAVFDAFPAVSRPATAGAALLGPAVASYTAVLAADTAVPAWHDGYRELPFVFVGSAAAAAAGMALITSPPRQSGPARAVAVLGTALEAAALRRMRRRIGVVEETYRTGTGGRFVRAAEALSAVGAAAALASRGRPAAVLAGAALLAASACTRFGVFHAGTASARDPRYTVLTQRARMADPPGA